MTTKKEEAPQELNPDPDNTLPKKENEKAPATPKDDTKKK